MPTTTTFLPTPRLRFHLRTHGAPGGMPMLFLHGSYASARWWELLFDLLPDEVFAVAPDLRGCGLTGDPANSSALYAIEEQAADVAALADALDAAWGFRNFDLVGHSSGGAVAIEVALNRPAALHTLVLVDSVPVEGVFTPLDAFIALEQMRSDRALLRRALAALMPARATEGDPFFDLLVEDAAAMAPAAFTEVAAALNRWNRFGEARALTLPTLLLWGELDQIVERDAATRTLIAIPGAANLEVLHGVGHSPPLEAPLALAERIIAFVAEDFAGYDAVRGRASDE